MELIDSHAHVDFPQFENDRDAVIERAQGAGLVALVNIGTNVDTSRASVRLAKVYDFVHATVGIHPHDADKANPEALDDLRSLAGHPTVVAVGEIGLDYYRDYSPRAAQRQAFQDQLTLASELGKPVVVGGYTGNFEPEMALLRQNGAILEVQNAEDLWRRFHELLSNPEFARAQGRCARAAVLRSQGATQRTLHQLEQELMDHGLES